MCGRTDRPLGPHHILDCHDLPNGGYVTENGITLCAGDDPDSCHARAERWHATGSAHPGYSPQDLFDRIGSSLEATLQASERLEED
jgi:hypothetical protein